MCEERDHASPLDKLTKVQRSYVADFAEFTSMEEVARWRGVTLATVADTRRKIMKCLDLGSLDKWSAFVSEYGDEAWETRR